MDLEEPSIFLAQILANVSVTYISIQLGILFILLVLSAMVSGSEVAYFSLTPQDIESCREDSNGKKMLKLLEQPQKLLASILIANNLINVAIVTISTYFSWELAGDSSEDNLIVFITPIVVTVCIVFFGEVIPKIYANRRSLNFARFVLYFLTLVDYVLTPFSWMLVSMTSVVERRMSNKGYQYSADEIKEALEVATADSEETTDEEKEILKGIVNFSSKTVKQVMQTRLDITTFDATIDFHQLMDKINKCGFSRIPIFRDTVDNIIGLLYIKDLLPFIENKEDFRWQKLLRPVYFIPESKKIDDLLKSFQEKRVHLAIVVDEYGGTSGLVTLEDIIEEIVGEINDEFDSLEIEHTRIGKNIYLFEGKTSLNDLSKVLDLPLDCFDEVKGESESIGGLLLEINSVMPSVGEEVNFNNFVFKIESASAKKIKKVKVIIKEDEREEQQTV